MEDVDTQNSNTLDEDGLEPATKPIIPVDLTPRDVAIFKLAHEHRYLAYGQIKEGFWKERSEVAKACYRRIERLVNSGYLKKGYSTKKSLDVYLVTEKSLSVLQERSLDSGLGLYVPSEKFDRAVDHDLKVASVRLLFRSLGLDSWTPERVLRERDHLYRVPDGILNVKGQKIALEFENHLTKSPDRYQVLLSEYSEQKTYWLVFIIVDGDTKDWLLRGLEYDAQRIWMTTYQELVRDKEEALFENRRGTFRLSRLL